MRLVTLVDSNKNAVLSEGTASRSASSSSMTEIQATERIAFAIRTILESIHGEHPDRNGLEDTPHRFARAFAKFTEGYTMTPEEVVGNAIFGDSHGEMVLVKNIPIYSLCEHHLVPFFGKAHIAYIPDPEKGIIGLSKLNRIADVFARRLQVQERLTREIMDALNRILQPKGVGVILECRHLCIEMRGVESPSTTTITKTTCGVFGNQDVSSEFVALALHGNKLEVPAQTVECKDNASDNCCEPHCLDSTKLDFANLANAADLARTSDDYRLYQSCATTELETITKIIQEALVGPMSEEKDAFSVLDIGAGNGNLLRALCSTIGRESIAHYAAFEQDQSLYEELRSTAQGLGFVHDVNSSIRTETFTPSTIIACADFVILSHSLYGSMHKEEIVEHALELVAPGGVLFVFHRWASGGTLDRLSEYLNSQGLIHQFSSWDIVLDVSGLGSDDMLRVSKYTKGDVSLSQDPYIPALRTIGCIAVEPHSCQLGNKSLLDEAVSRARKKVNYTARKKIPAVVVEPTTLIGIQACLRAASLQLVGSGSVSVIGGGHSECCLADNAIAINMRHWNHVVVDPNTQLVRVGGGATIGAITRECEKFGLAVPLGDRPGVGVGLILQGGLNHFMRAYGLACDQIVQVQYVSPTGKLHVAMKNEDMFPFCGAGSNFGVVLELTLRAHRLGSIKAQDTEYVLFGKDNVHVAKTYSQVASTLPRTACLDGFIFWSSHDKMSFATSLFDTKGNTTGVRLPLQDSVEAITNNEPVVHSPSGLFDRELYMTPSFGMERVVAPGSSPPKKLRSLKRCLLLPLLREIPASILFTAIERAPTKYCYVHILHGGGAVSEVLPTDTAFGHRNWSFAAVITGRWPDGNEEMEKAVEGWLEQTTTELLPHAVGIYGSDLGPRDQQLSLFAFGQNNLRLADLKRRQDPMNVLSCGCPLVGEAPMRQNDPRVQNRGVIVILCGRRSVGKDWLAQVTQQTLRGLVGDTAGASVSIACISDETKRAYSEERSNVDAEMLIHNRQYKESHRKDLTAFYNNKKAQDSSYDARCFVDVVQNSSSSIMILTGMRYGLEYARTLAGRSVVLVKVVATEESKRSRGWSYDPEIDDSPGECIADSLDDKFWDLCFENNLTSTSTSAAEWVKDILAPCILKVCTRHLSDTPKSGVTYQDLIGGVLLQPFGLTLCTGLTIDWLRQSNEMPDAVVVPEALGIVFASPIASLLKKPLVVVRKEGKLPGAVDCACHYGSNMQRLREKRNEAITENKDAASCSFEVVKGSIVPGQRILIVDDCLASGATLNSLLQLVALQGGIVQNAVCIMEFPDLLGRRNVGGDNGVDVFSLVQFPGK